MRIFILISVLFSTLPVLAMNLSPKSGEEVLAIFGQDIGNEDMARRARAYGLDVVSYDVERRHLVVRDVAGTSKGTLRSLGARHVLDAGFANLCGTQTKRTEV